MNGKWIWVNDNIIEDDYVEFIGSFESTLKEQIVNICADTNYAIYINNKYVNSGQYNSFPNEQVYDSIKIKTKPGTNNIKIVVYYLGVDGFSTYYKDAPGLAFEILENEKVLLASNENILSRRSKTYFVNKKLIISPQIGYRFFYDATKEKDNDGYKNSILVIKNRNFIIRPNKKLNILKPVESKVLVNTENRILVDLLKEQTGFIKLDFISPKKQKIIVSFGEHIKDGGVRRLIGNRDFSFEYTCKKGKNSFFNPLRRLGLRYIEIKLESEIKVNYVGLIPTIYPFIKKKYTIENELRQKIYDTSVYTLECCYHEHYEDCPWREQSLYALDSRNQMLAGYYAFKNKEQVKSSLKLIVDDRREDKLSSICYPTKFNLTIPSFSLHFFTSITEYYKYTKDIKFIEYAYPKLKDLLIPFINNMDKNLVMNFIGDDHWNFYEWMPHLDYPVAKKDVILNSLMILALEKMNYISKLLNKDDNYDELIKAIKRESHKQFFNKETGLYIFSKEDKSYSVLANSLAILSGIAKKKEYQKIVNEIKNNDGIKLIPITLSMKCFLYDALLKADKNNKEYILSDIDKVYKKMLDDGATTVYETELGEADFDGAGSLCHGWSAMPIYYYHLFKLGK